MKRKLHLFASVATVLYMLAGAGTGSAAGSLNLTGQWTGTSKGRTNGVTGMVAMTLGAPLGCCIYPVQIVDTITNGSRGLRITYLGTAMLSGNVLTFMVPSCNAKMPPWTLVNGAALTWTFACRPPVNVIEDFRLTHQ